MLRYSRATFLPPQGHFRLRRSQVSNNGGSHEIVTPYELLVLNSRQYAHARDAFRNKKQITVIFELTSWYLEITDEPPKVSRKRRRQKKRSGKKKKGGKRPARKYNHRSKQKAKRLRRRSKKSEQKSRGRGKKGVQKPRVKRTNKSAKELPTTIMTAEATSPTTSTALPVLTYIPDTVTCPSHPPCEQFTVFNMLPTELQLMIWERVPHIPRVVNLRLSYIFGVRSATRIPGMLHACRASRAIALKSYVLSFKCEKVISTNENRYALLRHHTTVSNPLFTLTSRNAGFNWTADEGHKVFAQVFFNFEIDTLFVNPDTWSIHSVAGLSVRDRLRIKRLAVPTTNTLGREMNGWWPLYFPNVEYCLFVLSDLFPMPSGAPLTTPEFARHCQDMQLVVPRRDGVFYRAMKYHIRYSLLYKWEAEREKRRPEWLKPGQNCDMGFNWAIVKPTNLGRGYAAWMRSTELREIYTATLVKLRGMT